MYEGKSATTYHYFCSQRTNLFQQTRFRKNQDVSKHRDTKSMERYDCNGMIRISINHTTLMATIYIRHHLLHPYPKDVSISDDIKQFIMNNIDLLPREIYARLVENGLDLSITSKQIHTWWVKLGQGRYRQHDDSFISAVEYLKKENHKIILNQQFPVRAIAFTTGIYDELQKSNIRIHECGIDATCK